MQRFVRGVSVIALALGACQPASDSRHGTSSATATKSVPRTALTDTGAADVFVRAFYQGYVPRGLAGGLAATDSLLLERPTLFAPSLLAALRQDAAARAAAVGEIDGLDFDPFLNSQDPCERYTVGPATQANTVKPNAVRVTVRAECDRASGPPPAFSVEVVPQAGTWQFVNFYYGPPAGDLLSLLRRLHPPPT